MTLRKKIFLLLITIVVLAVGWYGISPVFRNINVNEALPDNTTTETSERSGIVATKAHPASGYVRVIETTTGSVIRYEEFDTLNGPNLHVYLSKDLDANDYIDLGPIKATSGNINYEVPAGVDVSEYRYVLHWCVPFSVLFNYAEL